MRIVDADAFEKYAWSNPDIEVDGEPYISPSAVQNFAMDHPIEITPPNEPLRLEQLREMKFDPYVMIYDKPNAPKEVKWLQRWCNNKFIWRSCEKFEDYRC